MRQQRVLLVVAVDGAGGDNVVLVLIHQGQFGVVVYWSEQGGRQAQVKGQTTWKKHQSLQGSDEASTSHCCSSGLISVNMMHSGKKTKQKC